MVKDDKHNQQNEGLNYDSGVSKCYSNEQAQDLPVHYNNLPVKVIFLVSIIKESEFHFDCHSGKSFFLFGHEHVDDGRDTNSPGENADRSNRDTERLVLMLVANNLRVHHESLNAIKIFTVEYLYHVHCYLGMD